MLCVNVGNRGGARVLRARRVGVLLHRETLGGRVLGRAQHQHLQSHIRVHPDGLLFVVRVGATVDDQQRAAADDVVRVVGVAGLFGGGPFLDAGHDFRVGLALDVHAVHLHYPVALPEARALGRAAPVHLADVLAAGKRQTAAGATGVAVRRRFRLLGVQIEPVPVEVLGPGAQHAQSDGRLGHLWLVAVVDGHSGDERHAAVPNLQRPSAAY